MIMMISERRRIRLFYFNSQLRKDTREQTRVSGSHGSHVDARGSNVGGYIIENPISISYDKATSRQTVLYEIQNLD